MPVSLSLPMDARDLIPHEKPMRFVDRLVHYQASESRVEALIATDNPLLDEEGRLDGAAFLELLAQASAAGKGYDDLSTAAPVRKGFLVGVRRLHVVGEARVGDRLEIRVATVGTLGGFSIVEGEIRREGEVIASGTIKLFVMDGSGPSGEEA